MSPTPTPVAATDRVSDVLARDESLVEVFVRQGPQFAKLRHAGLRKVMARLVTVEQVAKMAGVEPSALVGELNAALGIQGGTETGAPRETLEARDPISGQEPAESAARHPAELRVVEVDVRPELRAGREPFSRIMAAVTGLGSDRVLLLRTTFEPIPLYSVLGRRGLAHETQRDAPDDWRIWFWSPLPNEGDTAASAATTSPGEQGPVSPIPSGNAESRTVRLDVRGLEPPEPMVRTLAALEELPPGQTLEQVNVRVPQFLLPVLAERGFAWEIDDSPGDRVIVRITRRNP